MFKLSQISFVQQLFVRVFYQKNKLFRETEKIISDFEFDKIRYV